MAEEPEINTTELAQTDNFIVWKAQEPDGETTYHLELGLVTIHFFREEWEELLALMQAVQA
jgi:hypothetical protein